MLDRITGTPRTVHMVLSVILLHPNGLTPSKIREHDAWKRYGGRLFLPSIDDVAKAGLRLQDAELIRPRYSGWEFNRDRL